MGVGRGKAANWFGAVGLSCRCRWPLPLSSCVTEECSYSQDKGSFVWSPREGVGEGGGGRSPARKGLLSFPLAGSGLGPWAGSTHAPWTPTSSAVPPMYFLILMSSFPFSEPQFLHLENGNSLPNSLEISHVVNCLQGVLMKEKRAAQRD